MDATRKKFLRQIGAAALLTGLPNLLHAEIVIDKNDFIEGGAPDDEKHWKNIAKKYYEVSKDYVNLENGYYCITPSPIQMAKA